MQSEFLVFSLIMQAVMDAYAYLREIGCLVNYRVSETWLREYQVRIFTGNLNFCLLNVKIKS